MITWCLWIGRSRTEHQIESSSSSPHEIADLYRKLESLPAIEQAKGILMGHYGVDAETAFRILTRWSQTGNATIRFVAESLTAAVHSGSATELPPYESIDQILDRDHSLGCAR